MNESGKQKLSEKVKGSFWAKAKMNKLGDIDADTVTDALQAAIAAYRSEHEAEVEGLVITNDMFSKRIDTLTAENTALQSRVKELEKTVDVRERRIQELLEDGH